MKPESEAAEKTERKGLWDNPDGLLASRSGDAKNVSGSTAGAGSGDFHVYRAQRRKELARVAEMEQQAAQAEEAKSFRAEAIARREKEEKRTEQRRRKRAIKKKRRKQGHNSVTDLTNAVTGSSSEADPG